MIVRTAAVAPARQQAECDTAPIPVVPPARRPLTRIASLDGLRGIAALVVVVYHVFLTQVPLAAPYADPSAPVDGAVWWAMYTPLHLFWAGPEAVCVFFVLSGLVLALPAASGRIDPWDYYPRRLVRLYLPVWAAVGLALAWAAAVPRGWPEGSSWWIVRFSPDATAATVTRDVLLVAAPGQFVHVLWSLQWEVLYCLLLPLALVAVRRFPRWRPVVPVLVTVAVVAGAALGNLALASLPLFVLGTLMAVEHRRLERWASALDRSRHAALWWALLVLSCVCLLMAFWLVHALPLPAAAVGTAEVVARGLQGLGAGLTVAVAWLWRGVRGPLTAPAMQWLGSRSFSLYLVHLPVVASVTLLLGVEPPLVLVLAGTLLVTLPLTEAFYRLVERPSHRIARLAGRAVAARARSAPAVEVAPSAGETGSFRRSATPASAAVAGGGVGARGVVASRPAGVPEAVARAGAVSGGGLLGGVGVADARVADAGAGGAGAGWVTGAAAGWTAGAGAGADVLGGLDALATGEIPAFPAVAPRSFVPQPDVPQPDVARSFVPQPDVARPFVPQPDARPRGSVDPGSRRPGPVPAVPGQRPEVGPGPDVAPRPEPVSLGRGFPLVTVLPSPRFRAARPAALFVPNVPAQASPTTPPRGTGVPAAAPAQRRSDRDPLPLGANLAR